MNKAKKTIAGFFCYDLSEASSSTLNRLAEKQGDKYLIKAYPLLMGMPTYPIKFDYHPAESRGNTVEFNNSKGTAPEIMWFGFPWRTISKIVTESDVICLLGLQGQPALFVALWAWVKRKPVITINQTMGPIAEKQRNGLIRIAKRWIFRHAKKNIAQTKPTIATLHDVYGIREEEIDVAPWDGAANDFTEKLQQYVNIDKMALRRKFDLPEKKYILLFCGSLFYLKGVDFLLDTFRKFHEGNPDAFLAIVGPDGAGGQNGVLDQLQTYVTNHNLGTSVRFFGNLEREVIAQMYLCSDVFILPTRKDIWPKVLVEAAMASLPIVTTSICGGAGFIVKHNENGFVIGVDNETDLMHAIEKLSNPFLRNKMGKKSKIIVEEYINNGLIETQVILNAIEEVTTQKN